VNYGHEKDFVAEITVKSMLHHMQERETPLCHPSLVHSYHTNEYLDFNQVNKIKYNPVNYLQLWPGIFYSAIIFNFFVIISKPLNL
jgi:hypothetical protein